MNLRTMKTTVFLLVIGFSSVYSLPRHHERIIGGSVTNINNYPYAASVQHSQNNIHFTHSCSCTIINNRSVMTAAHCIPRGSVASRTLVRFGSTNVNSGGIAIRASQLVLHPNYNSRSFDYDVGVIRMANAFSIGSVGIRAAILATAQTNVPDNSTVTVIGWGFTTPIGSPSEQLRHVQLRSVNHAQCQRIHGAGVITDNMICAIWPQGGRGPCTGDSGSGLVFYNTVIGISSFSRECASAQWPSVYTRVSRIITWIRAVTA